VGVTRQPVSFVFHSPKALGDAGARKRCVSTVTGHQNGARLTASLCVPLRGGLGGPARFVGVAQACAIGGDAKP
jgi:hypothetical protein